MKLSFTIPVYNGVKTLAATIESIIPQLSNEMELLLCDDGSTDGSVDLIEKYVLKYKNIRLICNESNLGMDHNFLKVIREAHGEYVWLSGQDDRFSEGAVDKLMEVLENDPEIQLCYFNYARYNHDFSKIVSAKSFTIEHDILLDSPEEVRDYFETVGETPGFLPATVMKRSLCEEGKVIIESFLGTKFVQMAVFLQHMPFVKTYLVADPQFVMGRNPDDGWQKLDGDFQMKVYYGGIEVFRQLLALNKPELEIAYKEFFTKRKKEFLQFFHRRVITFKARGFCQSSNMNQQMKECFGWKLYYFWIKPWMSLPKFFSSLIWWLYKKLMIKNLFMKP